MDMQNNKRCNVPTQARVRFWVVGVKILVTTSGGGEELQKRSYYFITNYYCYCFLLRILLGFKITIINKNIRLFNYSQFLVF